MDQEVFREVVEIISKILGVLPAELSEETAIGDIPSWDSIHHLQIITAIENNYDFRFRPDEMIEIEDISDIVNYVSHNQS